jgi:hypothetical protein
MTIGGRLFVQAPPGAAGAPAAGLGAGAADDRCAGAAEPPAGRGVSPGAEFVEPTGFLADGALPVGAAPGVFVPVAPAARCCGCEDASGLADESAPDVPALVSPLEAGAVGTLGAPILGPFPACAAPGGGAALSSGIRLPQPAATRSARTAATNAVFPLPLNERRGYIGPPLPSIVNLDSVPRVPESELGLILLTRMASGQPLYVLCAWRFWPLKMSKG